MTLITSILQGGVNSHTTSSEEVNALSTDFVSEGVVGTISNNSGVAPMTGAYAVNAQGTPNMTVAVSAGVGYVTATPTSGNSQTLRVKNSASANVTISSNSTGGTRYDWLYIKIDPDKAKDPAVDASDVATLVVSRSTSSSVDNGTPPTYGTELAVITVANGASSITNGNIRDVRQMSGVTITSQTAVSAWSLITGSITSVTANGNRSYTLTTSADNTALITPGMRLRTTRTVAAPITSFSLNGTNQYFSKTSPAGMTFTDDFAVSAWIKLSAYTTQNTIVSRFNGTSGWRLDINSSGQVELVGFNAGGGNANLVTSYQSAPLNKWVHIAAQLDMSTAGVSTTTSYVMIDAQDVPAFKTTAGTNPTSLIQAGNLEVGSQNGGGFPFSGMVAQVAVFSSKVTQATMQGYYSQGLVGTETNLISAYSGANLTDLNTTSANNLTANNSAVSGFASVPFGNNGVSSTLDYAIVMAVSGSSVTVQVPEGCTIPTTGGVSAVNYSSQRTPFGFPGTRSKWTIDSLYKAAAFQSSPSAGTWYNLNSAKITIPTGSWRVFYEDHGEAACSSASTSNYAVKWVTLSTGSNTESDSTFTSKAFTNNVTSNGFTQYREGYIELSSATPYYLNAKTDTATTSQITQYGIFVPSLIRAENAYL